MEAEAVHIRDIVAKPGTRAGGFLTIGETPTEPIRLPLVIVHGHCPGPRLCLTAGVHAAEYPGIDAVMQTIQGLDPTELAGTVVAVPVVNPPMFQRRSGFLSPIDGLNLNRTAPGRADGTISEVLAHVLLTEAGSNGTLEPADVEIHMRGMRNVMCYLGMIPGEPAAAGERVQPTGQFVVSAQRGGLLRLKIGIGDEIGEAQEIAEVCDLFGEVVERIHSPHDGIARLIWAHKAVNTGDPIVKCWIV